MSVQRDADQEQRNVESVIRGHAALNSGDVEGALEFISPEYELYPAVAGAFLGETVYRGHDGFRRYMADLKEVFEDFKVEPRRIATSCDWVVVDSEITGHGHASGVEIATDVTLVYRVLEGKAIWCSSYFQRADALRENDLNEEDLTPAE